MSVFFIPYSSSDSDYYYDNKEEKLEEKLDKRQSKTENLLKTTQILLNDVKDLKSLFSVHLEIISEIKIAKEEELKVIERKIDNDEDISYDEICEKIYIYQFIEKQEEDIKNELSNILEIISKIESIESELNFKLGKIIEYQEEGNYKKKYIKELKEFLSKKQEELNKLNNKINDEKNYKSCLFQKYLLVLQDFAIEAKEKIILTISVGRFLNQKQEIINNDEFLEIINKLNYFIDVTGIREFKSLEIKNCDFSTYSDETKEQFKQLLLKLKSLDVLSLIGLNLTCSDISFLNDCELKNTIRILDLSCNKLENLDFLKSKENSLLRNNYTNLKYLNISYNEITNMYGIEFINSLEEVDASNSVKETCNINELGITDYDFFMNLFYDFLFGVDEKDISNIQLVKFHW